MNAHKFPIEAPRMTRSYLDTIAESDLNQLVEDLKPDITDENMFNSLIKRLADHLESQGIGLALYDELSSLFAEEYRQITIRDSDNTNLLMPSANINPLIKALNLEFENAIPKALLKLFAVGYEPHTGKYNFMYINPFKKVEA